MRNLAEAGCPEEKLHVSPCGVDPDRFIPAAGLPHRIVAVGRLVDKKAPHLTIAAFASVARRFPEARLDIIGTGSLEGRCRKAIARHDVHGRVILHGVQPHSEVARLMQQASLFVQHSVTASDGDVEGMPVGILEAMASGLPVVATRHAGIAESVVQGETGLLVDEGDVEGMATAIAECLADPERAMAMGTAGRARVLEHHTHATVRDRLRAIMGLPPVLQAFEGEPAST